jgi:5-methylcytosine-specific restriction endonuclease McrA
MLIVVMGPPCSGKSTWISERAKPTDIVIDFDKLAMALSGPRPEDHDHSPIVDAVTKAARKAAIEAAWRHVDKTDVYLIHSNPGRHELAGYEGRGAQIVLLDPGREVVRARCAKARPRRIFAVIDQWYRDHESGGWTPKPRPARGARWSGGGFDPRRTYAWQQLTSRVFAEETHCWICHQWVDQGLPREHPMSRTVDHVEPVARGGVGVPDRAGVRLAHRSCNSRRGSQPDRVQPKPLTVPLASI